MNIQRWIFHEDCARQRFVSKATVVGKDQCMGECFRERRCEAGWSEF